MGKLNCKRCCSALVVDRLGLQEKAETQKQVKK